MLKPLLFASCFQRKRSQEEHIQMPFDLNENEEIPMGVSSPFVGCCGACFHPYLGVGWDMLCLVSSICEYDVILYYIY